MRTRTTDHASAGIPHASARRLAGILSVLLAICVVQCTQAAEDSATAASIQVIRSRHFVVHTDLTTEAAQGYVDNMESTLRNAHSYWKRPLRGQVQCYLVDDLSKWPRHGLPYAGARTVLERIGGGTLLSGEKTKRRVVPSSTIYATTHPGVVEHEVIHAYCFQTFGNGGPDWYREGIAELLASNSAANSDASCRAETLKILRDGKPLSLRTILSRGRFTVPLAESVAKERDDESVVGFDVAKSWNAEDDRSLATAKIAYAESWALCYLLHHNPNYQQRFRVFGQRVLAGADVDFRDMFRPVMRNIDFELKMLGANIGDGYRADLCRWPWMATFKPVNVGRTVKISLDARAGYQATRIHVRRGECYTMCSTGTWRVDRNSARVTADGLKNGHGKIEAVVVQNFELSGAEQFGRESVYVVRSDGNLFLRCHDDWHRLSDNLGSVHVRITRTK